MSDVISVRCPSREDAAAYREALQKAGFEASILSYTNPKVVEVRFKGAGLDMDDMSAQCFEVYAKKVAN